MKILIGVISLIVVVTLYTCLVVASKSDEKMGIKE